MPASPRPSRRASALALAALGAAATVLTAGCASLRSPAPAMPPAEIYRSLLGHNPGLSRARAIVEARISFAGSQVSLPGVVLLDALGGFRLELLDPLDRPLAIIYAEEGRIVQYRPGQRSAASLGVFPVDCRGVDPAAWVTAVTASSLGPVAGEQLLDRGVWGGGRTLERSSAGQVRQSVRYQLAGIRMVPHLVSWYCDDDPVLQLRLDEWIAGADWQLPTRIGIEYPKAGLSVALELTEIETNPAPADQPLRPTLGTDIRWTSWNLPR